MSKYYFNEDEEKILRDTILSITTRMVKEYWKNGECLKPTEALDLVKSDICDLIDDNVSYLKGFEIV